MSSRNPMDQSKLQKIFLRSSTALPLNERFSQLLAAPQAEPGVMTFDPVVLQQRTAGGGSLVLLVQTLPSGLLALQSSRRRSVWTRLGRGQQVARHLPHSRLSGFWSFRKKYRWRVRARSCRKIHSVSQCRVLMRRRGSAVRGGRKLSISLQRGGATSAQGRGLRRAKAVTKRELDAQLDEYMSMSRGRLDAELDHYMSMSKSRLDAQLDEYMSMAGQQQDWD